MAQFTYYTGSDAGATSLTGTSGSLLSVLDACLVNGYGAKPGAGWTKPHANSNNVGCYQQGTGSFMHLMVVDNALTTSAEARITGFVSMSSVSAGTSSFPTVAQGVNGNALIVRKNRSTGSIARAWKVFADSSSFYMFIDSGDNPGRYYAFSFGDFYSYASVQPDKSKCMIVSRTTESSSLVAPDRLDTIGTTMTLAVAGHYVVNSLNGTYMSDNVNVHGDTVKGDATFLLGTLNYPNVPDSGIYVSPVWVASFTGGAAPVANLRGTMRGFYQILHPIANLTDGQQFSGSGVYSSKIFEIVKSSTNLGVYCIEISNTLDTN